MSDTVCYKQVWFSGHVQGVGFRYKVTKLADGFEVTGQVANLADGRVHLQVEGKKEEVEAFVDEINVLMKSFIKETESEEQMRKPSYRGFIISG